jgi:dTDP-4-amino-4,6-dideoxygalactose transaminase
VWHAYERALGRSLQLQTGVESLEYNYAYFPVVFNSEELAVRTASTLKENGVMARRYFYPSLESVKCLAVQAEFPVSADVASRIICLPVYSALSAESIENVRGILSEVINK